MLESYRGMNGFASPSWRSLSGGVLVLPRLYSKEVKGCRELLVHQIALGVRRGRRRAN